jgi:integrase
MNKKRAFCDSIDEERKQRMFGDHNVKGSIAHKIRKIPRSIPTDILPQLDLLLMRAVQMMESEQEPGILKPVYWDAILILRRTGIRFEDLIHLKTLDDQGRSCCLDHESGDLWWLHISRKTKNVIHEYRIPLRKSDGVVEALYRQRERVKNVPSSTGRYLFRNQERVLKSSSLRAVLARDLAPHLIHAGQPYVITPLQFRHTIAFEMIEQGIDIYTVKEFLGYSSLAALGRYVSLSTNKTLIDYDLYRAKGSGMCLTSHSMDIIPCPQQCPTSSNGEDAKSNLPPWQDGMNKKLLITIEAFREKAGFGKADQKHTREQELQEQQEVIETIQQEGDEDGSCPSS